MASTTVVPVYLRVLYENCDVRSLDTLIEESDHYLSR